MAKEKNGKLALHLAIIIAAIMIALSVVESVFVEGKVKKEVTELNTERYVDVANRYATTITKIIDEYMAHLDFYVNSDIA